MGGFSYIHWLIVLAIVILVFGTKKIANIGSDLGKAVKGFKDGIKGEDEAANKPAASATPPSVADKTTIDVEAKEKSKT